MTAHIKVVGARQNNLDNVSVAIPKGMLTVVTGVSGSGKSSLVFDRIAAESQRQLAETFPVFVRNRLPHSSRPDAESLHNLSATIVVDQRRLGSNARSTVGTATDIAPLLRLLYSRVATPHVGFSPAFSFNDPHGMCPRCEGLGTVVDVDLDVLLDRDRSLDEGAIRFPTFLPGTVRWKRYVTPGLFDTGKPLRDYTDDEWRLLLHADGIKPERPLRDWPPTSTYQGLLPRFRRLYLTRGSDGLPAHVQEALRRVVTRRTCPDCGGARLNAAALGATIDGRSIADCARMEVGELAKVMRDVDGAVAAPMVEAVVKRLDALVAVGLGYLSLDRETPTLSGGEAQRIKLVRHLGSSLTGLTYVFDEPSTGLHPHDVGRLVDLLRALRDHGNTVIVVEHDADLIAAADHVVDMGPGAGSSGGRVVYEGPPGGLRRAATPTGRHLGRPRSLRRAPRRGSGTFRVTGGRHNVRGVDVPIPQAALTVVTGVAGSGKSTFAAELLPRCVPGVLIVDQSGVRGSRRSTPATYTGVIEPIREAFAARSGARPSLFSANGVGACPECKGRGEIRTELAFLDDVTTPCEACDGTGFSDEALRHTLEGRTIADVLALTVIDAREVFAEPGLQRLDDVGLGYLTLGQPVSTLSGGERQRLKLAAQLDTAPGRTLVLDEPTVGLHMSDVSRLVDVFDRLVEQGSTVIVVEHDVDVVARADWVVDFGPGAGRDGGKVLFAGLPGELAEHPSSITAGYLRAHVGG